MGMVPRGRDIVDRQLDHESRIRFQEIRRQASGPPFTVTHTLLRAGEVVAGEYIPPLIVQIDPNNDTPEAKQAIDVGEVLRLGSASISWLLNDTDPMFTGFTYDLNNGDQIRPVVDSVSGAVDLSAYVTIRIIPGT